MGLLHWGVWGSPAILYPRGEQVENCPVGDKEARALAGRR